MVDPTRLSILSLLSHIGALQEIINQAREADGEQAQEADEAQASDAD
ncbi:hypothetical protein [Streptomyces sp. NPDC093589]